MGMLMRVLLALVLVELAVGAKGGDCKDGGLAAICEVMAIEGEVATLMCGQEKSSINDSGISNNTPVEIIVEPEDKLHDNIANDYIVPGYVNTFGEETKITLGDNGERKLYKDGLNKTYNKNNKIMPAYITDRLNMYNKNENTRLPDKRMLGYTDLKVMLNSTVYLLDLRPFSSVKSITINTLNNSLLKTCAASKVSDFSIVDSQLKDFPVIRDPSSIKKLNFSDNNIKYMSFKDLPSSIKSLDLSFNSIVFPKNIELPESLEYFDISFNNIMLQKNTELKGNLATLNLSGNKLNSVPVIDMTYLKYLDLSENKISSLNPNGFEKLKSLNILNLRRNKLSTLKDTEFEGLSNLEVLDISENNITSLSSATFQNLTNLVTLKLSGNVHLGTIPNVKTASLLFGTGQRLQIIEASNTSLTRIPPTLTTSVRKLQLSENAINSIQCGELDNFPLLQSVDLSSNRIDDIEDDALGRLDMLTDLRLTNNKLKIIPRSLPIKLDVLDMRCNVVENLKTSDFLGIQNLRILLISRNQISNIEDRSFHQLIYLQVLDLSHNPILFLSSYSFIGPMRLKELHLASLKDLINFPEPLSFPAPESPTLEVLNIESSPVLANQLMDDQDALKTLNDLSELNLNDCNLSTLPSELPNYLPRLKKLYLNGNPLKCAEIMWLVKWIHSKNIYMQGSNRYRQDIYNSNDVCYESGDVYQNYETAVCASPEYLSGREIISLKEEDFSDFKLINPPLSATTPSVIIEHYLQESSPNSGHSKTSSNNDVIEMSSSPDESDQQSTNPTSEEMLFSVGTTQQTPAMSEIESESVTSTLNNIVITVDKSPLNHSKLVTALPSTVGYINMEANLNNDKEKDASPKFGINVRNENPKNKEQDAKSNPSAHLNYLLNRQLFLSQPHSIFVFFMLLCSLLVLIIVLNYGDEDDDEDDEDEPAEGG